MPTGIQQGSRVDRIIGLLDADPSRTWTVRELADVLGGNRDAIASTVALMRKRGLALRVLRGCYCSVLRKMPGL
jgi:hypothetical protein